jgi:hypothetical protein
MQQCSLFDNVAHVEMPVRLPSDAMADKPKPTRENSERLATWLDKNLAHKVRIRAAVDNVAIREIVETALLEYLDAHPLSVEDIENAIKLDD